MWWLFFLFLNFALIAFGWQPCCCGIVTACCPGVSIPTTLTLTVSSTCACIQAAMPLTYAPAFGNWSGGYTSTCGGGGMTTESHSFLLSCDGFGQWRLDITEVFSGSAGSTPCGLGASFKIAGGGSTCSPFSLVFTGTLANVPTFAACTCGAGTAWTITVTP